MKINRIDLRSLRNEEHYQFCTDTQATIGKYDAKKLDIEEANKTFIHLFSKEDDVLQQIRKSDKTASLSETDRARDILLSGISLGVKSMQCHFDVAKKSAADRIAILLDQYGNIARKSYNDETAAITKLVSEATGTYANDFTTIGMMEWIVEVDRVNKDFAQTMRDRYSDDAGKADYNMKEIRDQVNDTYYGIVQRLDALMLINGPKNYEAFAKELNVIIEKYDNILAQRAGRAEKKKAE